MRTVRIMVTVDTVSTVSTASAVVLSQRGCALRTCTSKSSANRSWLAVERISALLTSSESTALLPELGHGDGREGGGSVVLGFVLVDLVDRDGGVNNGWLDGLLFDDGLDVLVDVVVNVLPGDCWCGDGLCLTLSDSAGVLELSGLGGQTFLYVLVVAVLDVAFFGSSHLVAVLFG